MGDRQIATPVVVRGGKASRLSRVPFPDHTFSEGWLQELLFANPTLLPIGEIEEVFGDPILVARELETGKGPVDLVCVNERGFITLVETKLWRNPEARRSVVAQIVDYAAAMANWSYERFWAAMRDSTNSVLPVESGISLTDSPEEFDDKDFVDSATKNLRLGRFLLLIVGDGIREDVESIVNFLQEKPSLGFTLGLVELGIYRDNDAPDKPIYVQPSIVARTREIVRAIVEIKTPIDPANVRVSIPSAEMAQKTRRRITEEEFIESIESVDRSHEAAEVPAVQQFVREVLTEAPNYKLEIVWGANGPIFKYNPEDVSRSFTFGKFGRGGRFGRTASLKSQCQELELPDDIWRDYLGALARIMAHTEADQESLMKRLQSTAKNDAPPYALLVGHKEEWFAAIDRATHRIDNSLENLRG